MTLPPLILDLSLSSLYLTAQSTLISGVLEFGAVLDAISGLCIEIEG